MCPNTNAVPKSGFEDLRIREKGVIVLHLKSRHLENEQWDSVEQQLVSIRIVKGKCLRGDRQYLRVNRRYRTYLGTNFLLLHHQRCSCWLDDKLNASLSSAKGNRRRQGKGKQLPHLETFPAWHMTMQEGFKCLHKTWATTLFPLMEIGLTLPLASTWQLL